MDCNHNGICTCKPNVSGDKCDQCQDGYINFPNCDQCDTNYHGFPDCKVCTCNPQGSENTTCDKVTGECTCKAKVSGASCDTCEEGSYGFPDCQGRASNSINFISNHQSFHIVVQNVDAVVKDLWMKVKRAPHKEPVFARQDIKETNVNYVLKDIIYLEITCLKNALVIIIFLLNSGDCKD